MTVTEDFAASDHAPLLLSVPSVAKRIGIGKSKCWELIASGSIFSVRIGKRRLVPRGAVDEYIEQLIATSGTER